MRGERVETGRSPQPPAGAGHGAGSLGVVWAGRGLAAFCAAAGFYAAAISLLHISDGEAGGTWLLPLCAGVLMTVLGIAVACDTGGATIALRTLAPRAAAMVLLAAYACVLLPFLGFLTASIVLVLAVTMLYAARRRFVGIGGLVIAVGMWALFAYALAEPLPSGLWWR